MSPALIFRVAARAASSARVAARRRAVSVSVSVAALLAATLGAGCKGHGGSSTSCSNDPDCRSPGTRCDTASRRCVCATDAACDPGAFCNRSGICQVQAGCTVNADCLRPGNGGAGGGGSGTFCDLASGLCLSGPAQQLGSKCGLASQCPYGSVCKEGGCQAGCFDDGDCILGQLCSSGTCVTAPGICSNKAFCAYGEGCDLTTSPGHCTKDRRGPYCEGCGGPSIQNPEPCKAARNFCLINSQESNGHPFVCGVDCSDGQDCPNGFDCTSVVILTQQICTLDADCRCDRALIVPATATCTISAACDPRLANGRPDPNATVCVVAGDLACNPRTTTGTAACVVPRGEVRGYCQCGSSADCPAGATCVGGACCGGGVAHPDRTCSIEEGAVSGFCTCATDADCPTDVCDSSRNACSLTGAPCTPGGGECGAIACVDGGCFIGKNCAPIRGLSCSLVTGSG